MAFPNWAFGWLAYAALVIGFQVVVCGGDAPTEGDNVASSIAALFTGTYCDSLHFLVSLLLFATLTIPGLILLFELLSPFLNNTVTGTIVGVLGLVTVVTGLL